METTRAINRLGGPESHFEALGIIVGEQLAGGHTEASLYAATSNDDQRSLVVKIGSSTGVNTEVEGNHLGYQNIDTEGAGNLLPSPLQYGEVEGRKYIVMPHLGADMARADREDALTDEKYDIFVNEVVSAVEHSTHDELTAERQTAGLHVVRDQTVSWLDKAADQGESLPTGLIEWYRNAQLGALATSRSSVMIMDFTPDNVFITDNHVALIDPWAQATYRGSFIPAFAQFMAISLDVYKLQGAIQSEQTLESGLRRLGDLLLLKQKQVRGQQLLGRALQFSLSGFVRIGSDDVNARRYFTHVGEALSELHSIVNGQNDIKNGTNDD